MSPEWDLDPGPGGGNLPSSSEGSSSRGKVPVTANVFIELKKQFIQLYNGCKHWHKLLQHLIQVDYIASGDAHYKHTYE